MWRNFYQKSSQVDAKSHPKGTGFGHNCPQYPGSAVALRVACVRAVPPVGQIQMCKWCWSKKRDAKRSEYGASSQTITRRQCRPCDMLKWHVLRSYGRDTAEAGISQSNRCRVRRHDAGDHLSLNRRGAGANAADDRRNVIRRQAPQESPHVGMRRA